MAYRIERLEKIIERELSNILFTEAHNEKLKYVSITKVALNKDASVAQIWYTVLGQEDEIKATCRALENARGFLRSQLAQRLDIYKVPELRFKYDESIEYGKHIEEVLENIHNENKDNK